MIKYILYMILIFTFIGIFNCGNESEKFASNSKTIAKYYQALRKIETKKQELADHYRYASYQSFRDKVIKETREFLFNIISVDIIPQWYGTPWDFNGTTEIPRKGKIACGYFVTTILRDAGFKVQRAKLAQQASETIIKSLTNEAHIKRFSNVPIDTFIEAIQKWGKGFYLIGLDIHIGFIIYDKEGIFFIHSSYIEPMVVLKENAKKSSIIRSSKYRVLGKLSGDNGLIIKWLQGNNISIKMQ